MKYPILSAVSALMLFMSCATLNGPYTVRLTMNTRSLEYESIDGGQSSIPIRNIEVIEGAQDLSNQGMTGALLFGYHEWQISGKAEIDDAAGKSVVGWSARASLRQNPENPSVNDIDYSYITLVSEEGKQGSSSFHIGTWEKLPYDLFSYYLGGTSVLVVLSDLGPSVMIKPGEQRTFSLKGVLCGESTRFSFVDPVSRRVLGTFQGNKLQSRSADSSINHALRNLSTFIIHFREARPEIEYALNQSYPPKGQ